MANRPRKRTPPESDGSSLAADVRACGKLYGRASSGSDLLNHDADPVQYPHVQE
jgi:hypothetical protein